MREKTPKTFNDTLVKLLVSVFLVAFGWSVGSGRINIENLVPTQRYISVNRSEKLDYSDVDAIYSSLTSRFDGELDKSELIEGMKRGLVEAAGDPYTEYMSYDEAKSFNESLSGTFEGIGAELGKDEDNNIIIISPIAGYPAYKAGLQPKDLIAEIDGESAYDITLSQAVERIRGEKGTEVKLKVVRKGRVEEFAIKRGEINIPSVKWEIKNNIGILTISRFSDDTVGLSKEAAEVFKKKGVRGVVLDLRGNTGGYLNAAVNVSELWVDNGSTILTERRAERVIQTFKSNKDPELGAIKTVVLINGGSASASEIVAGALKDNNKATLIGEKSYGKGSVQEPVDVKGGGLLKITIARWYTPSGKNIDKEGITPDSEIEMSYDDLVSGRDPQLDRALGKLSK